MNSRIAFVLAACVAGWTGLVVAGTTYWKDKDGKLTDVPVAGAEKVTVKVPGAEGDTSAQDGTQPADAASGDRDAIRAEQCKQATKRLNDYNSSGSIYEQDETGHRHELTANERVDLIVKARRDVRDLCDETRAAQ